MVYPSGIIRREVIGREYFGCYKTAIGALYIISDAEAITAVMFSPPAGRLLMDTPTALTDKAACQIQEYLEGTRKTFDLPLKPAGSNFYWNLWGEVQKIPYGKTNTYREIAVALGSNRSTRFMFQAIYRNPLAIMIPCHRVIASNGKLMGYGGGIMLKSALLEMESKDNNSGLNYKLYL